MKCHIKTLSIVSSYKEFLVSSGCNCWRVVSRTIFWPNAIRPFWSCFTRRAPALPLSELTGLNLEQLDLADGLVEVLGKGSKTRVLPVGKKAREALQAWLAVRLLANPKDDAVFVSQRGTRLGPRAIQMRVKAAGERDRWARHPLGPVPAGFAGDAISSALLCMLQAVVLGLTILGGGVSEVILTLVICNWNEVVIDGGQKVKAKE